MEELILNIEEEKMAFVTIKLHKMCILILCGNFVQEVKKKDLSYDCRINEMIILRKLDINIEINRIVITIDQRRTVTRTFVFFQLF
jgi:hypothetical protein